MSSYTPKTDLWLERSRLDGMLLGGVSYGIFFLLTIQAMIVLSRKPRQGGQIAHHRWMLISYIWITFLLATIGFAGNARYTEMIWIDLRDAPGGPPALIFDELNYRVNMVALGCYYVMEWFMQALLLYRCFSLWNWQPHIVVSMSTVFLAMIAMSILVLAQSSGGATFYNINTQLAYLCLEVGLTITYTFLVAGRLFFLRKQLQSTLGKEHIRPYDTAAIMVVESAAPYTALGIIFIVSFALHSDVCNLVFLSVSHVQGIAQLLIIIRVARGREICNNTSLTPISLPPSAIAFSSGLSSKTATDTSERLDPLKGTTDIEHGMVTKTEDLPENQ